MSESEFHLFATRRFAPLFVVQFLGALNDNLFKNAVLILIVYRLAGGGGFSSGTMVNIAAGLFIAPFFLFSASAGQLADKLEKARLIRLIKLGEIVIMALAAWGLITGWASFLLVVLFLMGAQSAFFGPLKYSILPEHLRKDELIAGNGLIEAGTFLAILAGTLIGGLLILSAGGVYKVSALVLAVAVAGWLASRAIPRAGPCAPGLRINPDFLGETRAMLRFARVDREIFHAILGISWFWLLGSVVLAQFPGFVKSVLGANEQVVTLFLALFSIGVGLGSLACNTLLAGRVSARYAPVCLLGLAGFMIDLFFASPGAPPAAGELIGAAVFLSGLANGRIMLDLTAIALCGGLFIVPLYALLQSRARPAHRARVIAANNIMNALFMVIGAAFAAGVRGAGLSIPALFLVLALASLGVAAFLQTRGSDDG